MVTIILGAIFLLLVSVIIRQEKEAERWFWAKIIVLFLSCLLTFNIGTIRLPLGIIIAFIQIVKFSKHNKSLKRLTLLFSFVSFILANYLIPPIHVNQVLYAKEIQEQMYRFEEIDSVVVFAKESTIQDEIREYSYNHSLIMFQTYIMLDRCVQIKSEDWLIYESNDELDYYWQSSETETKPKRTSDTSSYTYGVAWMNYIRFNKTGEEYIGFFERDEGEIYLKYVIKGKLKNGGRPSFIF